MKLVRFGFALTAAALLLLAYGGSQPQAFHSGGVAECAGCHSMHSPKPNGSYLLIGSDVSSTCLSCHENSNDTGPSSYHVSTVDSKLSGTQVPLQRTPGGDFGWLKKTYTYSASGTNYTEDGATHGHNIIAADFGYVVDGTSAPGGTYPSNRLACDSCHDPHGKYRRTVGGTVATSGATGGAIWASGSYPTATIGGGTVPAEPRTFNGENLAVGVYRLLAGSGYLQGGPLGTPINFPGVPAAKVPSGYNRSEATSDTRAAYGVSAASGHTTWGNWCGTCHPNMHSTTGGSRYVHPVDQQLGSPMATAYTNYVKSGDNSGAAPYLSLVPFMQGTGDYTALAANAVNNVAPAGSTGPSSTDQVACLSCHRAHASGFMEDLRFDIEYEFMTKEGNYVGSDNPAIGTSGRGPLQSRGRTIAEWQGAYYDRPATRWSAFQRVLCNKCHVKD